MATVGRAPRSKSLKLILKPRGERPRPSARRMIIAIAAVTLLIAVWIAPWMVGRSSLRHAIINWAVPNTGNIQIGSASFGWFSSVVLTDVQVNDAHGHSLLTADSLTLDRSLLGLAMNARQLGTLQLTRPVVNLEIDDEGSNFEETFAPLLDGPSDEPVSIKLAVIDGALHLDDRTSDKQYDLQNLNGAVTVPDGTSPIVIDAEGMLPTTGQPASFKVAIESTPTSGTATGPRGKAICQIKSLPLSIAQPFLRRSLEGAELGGRLHADIQAEWGAGESGEQLSIDGELRATDFELTATSLNGDLIALDEITLPCRVIHRAGKFNVEELSLKSDLGSFTLTGYAPVKNLTKAELLGAFTAGDYEARGKLNLARLTHMLAQTLRLREGTQITRGEVNLSLQSKPAAQGSLFTGELATTSIEAIAHDQEIEWREPLTASFSARHTDAGFIIDQARCDSSFLRIEAEGSSKSAAASATFDLARLMSELQQFADLPDLELAGNGKAELTLERLKNDQIEASGTMSAANFKLQAPGRRTWTEPSIQAEFHIVSSADRWTFDELSRASLDISAGSDRLSAALVNQAGANSTTNRSARPIAIEWQGELAKLLPRIEPWLKLDGWDLAGKGDLTALVIPEAEVIQLQDIDLKILNIHAWGPRLFIDEPSLRLVGNAAWASKQRRLDVSNSQIDLGGLRAQVDAAEISLPEKGAPQLGGQFEYQADLQQLDRWFHNPQSLASWRMAGSASGRGTIKRTSGITTGRIETTIANLQLDDFSEPTAAGNASLGANLTPVRRPAPRPQQAAARATWREKQLKLVAAGTLTDKTQTLEIEQAELTSDSLSGKLAGQYKWTGGKRYADLQGELTYDWQTLAPLWRPYLGKDVDLVGRETRRFAVRGPLPSASATDTAWIKELEAEGGLRWEKAEFFGVEAGPAEVTGRLAAGVLQVSPLDLQVAEGRILLAPQFRVLPTGVELRLPRGPAVSGVRVTPEICARALKYVAPILAEATRAEGKFSIELEGAKIPISDPSAGDLAGKLSVHSVEVKPGPLADQVIFLAKQIEAIIKQRTPNFDDGPETLLSMENQEVDFRMVDRRVYHRGVTFNAGDVPVTTHGSVGLDETLAIMAEVTIDETWVGNDPALSGLRGKKLQIPIEGTLKNPKLDRSAIQQLSGQLIKDTARGVLFNELNKQLEKLIPVPKE